MQHVELVWPPCCMMLYDIEQSLISIKDVMQHRLTFFLFSCVNYKVALIWLCTSKLLHYRTRSKSSLSIINSHDVVKKPHSLRFIQFLVAQL